MSKHQNFNFARGWGGPLCGWMGGDGWERKGRVEHVDGREPHGLVRVVDARKYNETKFKPHAVAPFFCILFLGVQEKYDAVGRTKPKQ